MPFFLHRVVGQETQLQRVRGETLLIGRGTGAQLRFPEDASVDLEHALIRQDEKGYLLVDQGSVTGTYLNGQAIERARLSDDDRIEIGGYQLRVQIAHKEDPLFLHVRPVAAPEPLPSGISTRKVSAETARTVTAMAPPAAAPAAAAPAGTEAGAAPTPRRIDYAAAYALKRPGVGKASLSLLGLAAAAVAAWVAFAAAPATTRPGPVSDAHAAVGLGADCARCHAPWRGVVAQRCEACHAGPEHQPTQAFEPPCGGCHNEHRRLPRLARVGDEQCVTCHRELTLAGGGEPRVARRITGFDDHPDFRPPTDADPLRLNHALHLKPGLRGPEGPVQLECEDCHAFDAASDRILPVTFEQHCQSCHDLHFDDRFPDRQAPHGDPEAVVLGIFGAFAGGGESLTGLSDAEVRSLIFSGRGGGLAVDERVRRQAFTAADHLLRHRCTLCHVMEITSVREVRMEEPAIPAVWLEGARFSHGPHRLLACTDCHGAAAESRRTADVLIPVIAACTPCHGSAGQARAPEERVPTTCVTCHHYHARTAAGWEATLAGRPPGRGPAGEGGAESPEAGR